MLYRTVLALATSIATGMHPAPAAAPIGSEPVVVFLGDSLTAGYGLPADHAYPARIGEALKGRGLPVRVINAGVSGDTSAGGLRRLPWLLTQRPAVVVVALGANDGLRGQPLEATEENLDRIIVSAREAGAEVLLAGMAMPPNLGPDYTVGFRAIYPRLAKRHGVPLVPFLLEGVGGRPALNQPDGIHPTAEGQKIVAENVMAYLVPLVKRAIAHSRAAP